MHAVTGTGRLIAGRYRLQGPIGRGAMGIVWRGRDELLARDVAVKEVQIATHAPPADAEVIYQRTLREARTAARLSHPSVVTVFDVVEENGTPWIVMELVEARSLDRVITEDGPLPPLQAAELGTSLISALSTAHAAGVLHRDVKPSNVLVTSDGRAVLTDFGIATFAEDPGMTQAGMVVGTPGFTAPERIRGDVATPASDLWSLGATLYAAVEGRGPFDRVGGSSAITAGVAIEDAPRAPSAGPLGPVIDALLSRDPGTRPDVTTASRMLAEAATAARTGARPLGQGWLVTEAVSAEHAPADPDGTTDSSPVAADSGSGEQRAAFLDPPVFAELSMPEMPGSDGGSDASMGQLGAGGLAAAQLAGAAGLAASAIGAGAIGAGGIGAGEAGAGVPAAAVAVVAAGSAVGADAPLAPANLDGEPVGASSPAAKSGQGIGGPVLWQPIGSAAAPPAAASRPSGGPSGPTGTGGGGDGQPGGSGGPPKRSSGRWRLMVAGVGIAAIAIAAVVGWNIYSHSPSAQLLQAGPSGPQLSAGGTSTGSSRAHPGRSGPASGGNHSAGSTPTSSSSGGSAAGHGKKSGGHPSPSGSPSGRPSPSPSGSSSPSTSPSPSSSPSVSPSPSQSTGPGSPAPVLPAGYKWHRFTAAMMGTVAGFKIGLPDAWTQSVVGLVAHLNQPVRGFHLAVNLGAWTYTKPLVQAQYIYGNDALTYHDFKLLTLAAVGFKSVGGFKAAPAAELKFSWHKPSVGNFTELVILVTLNTKSGLQPYTFTLWAPSAEFAAARAVLSVAMQTFRPLPLPSATA